MRGTQFDDFLSKTTESNDLDAIIASRHKSIESRQRISSLIRLLLIVVVTVFVLLRIIFGIAIVKGTSMVPAYKDGDVVLFVRVLNEYRMGDVVLIETGNVREDYFKRIIGLPGQTVDIDDSSGEVLIDGEPLAEPYIYVRTVKTGGLQYPVTLGEDEYFVLGDNRTNSKDSRVFGPIKESEIDGKVFFVVRASN